MEIRSVDRTGLSTTVIGFGGAPIGNYGVAISDRAAQAALQACWNGGVRTFDTAPLYGTGLSERRIGEFLRSRPRGEITVSTKVGRLIAPNPSPVGAAVTEYGFHVSDDLSIGWDFSRGAIRKSVEDSLERLGLESVDIAYIHDPDDHAEQALTEAYRELEAMRREGTVRAIGVGMNQWELPLRFVQETNIDVVMLAGRYTLADQSGKPLLDACLSKGVAVVAAAPFNSGLLSNTDVSDDTTFNYVAAPLHLIERVRAIARICSSYGVELPHAALRFPLLHPAVCSVVPGIRTVADAEGAVASTRRSISPDLWAELEDADLLTSPGS